MRIVRVAHYIEVSGETDWTTEAQMTLCDSLEKMRLAMDGNDCAVSVKELIDIARCSAEIVFENEYGGSAGDEDEE